MLSFFSTRELAMGIYMAVLLIYVLCHAKSRKALLKVVKIAASPRISVTALILAAVGIGAAFYASRFSVWDNAYYKDVVMWALFVGWPLCFGAISSKEKGYFRNAIVDNLKFMVLFDCVFSTFTFPLWAEMLIIPATTIIALLEMVAKREEKSKAVAKLMGGLLTIIGFVVLYFTVRTAIAEFKTDMTSGMVASLIIPFILSILYVPFAYLLALYAAYEVSFLRMKFCEPDNRWIRLWHRIKALIICNFSLDKARTLQKSARYMFKSMTEKEFNAYLRRVWNKNERANL